jgi:hypothetical protein
VTSAPGPRRVSAIRKASRTRSVRMWAANCVLGHDDATTTLRIYAHMSTVGVDEAVRVALSASREGEVGGGPA